MKKNIFLTLLISLSILISSCKKEIGTFKINNESEAVIPATTSLFPFSILAPETENNATVEFENNNTKADFINSIKLNELKISVIAPSGEDFSFLKSIEVFISSTNNAEQKVAFKDNIPSTVGSELTCDIVDLDLKEYIKDDKLKIRVATITDETIPEDVKIKINSVYLVKAKLIK